MKASRYNLLLWVALALGISSCGPAQTSSSISSARKAMEQARLAGATELHPGSFYVTTAQYKVQVARLYLEKAKELQGFSKFEDAIFYATEARKLLDEAVTEKHEEERRLLRRKQIKEGRVFHEQK